MSMDRRSKHAVYGNGRLPCTDCVAVGVSDSAGRASYSIRPRHQAGNWRVAVLVSITSPGESGVNRILWGCAKLGKKAVCFPRAGQGKMMPVDFRSDAIMTTVKYVHWQEDDAWLGYLEEYPDY